MYQEHILAKSMTEARKGSIQVGNILVDEDMKEMAELESTIFLSREAGEPALLRLISLVETRNSGQIAKIARFLAGLYNGYAYPFDLTDLRCVDQLILNDCLLVLRMDATPEREVHQYIENGQVRWQEMIERFGIKPVIR